MPQCPVCSANIEENFGMVMCPSCGTAVFIDIYGNLQVASSEARIEGDGEGDVSDDLENDLNSGSAHELSEEPFSLSLPDETTEEEYENTAYEMAPVEEESFAVMQAQPEPAIDPSSEDLSINDSQFFGHTSPSAVNEPVQPEGDFVNNLPESDEQLGESSEEMVLFDPSAFMQNEMQSAPVTSKEVMGEIQDFGNSVSKEGISYFLRISNIDTSEVRKELLEELRDARFGWNIQEVAAKIKKGELFFEDINPVSASILVNRLKSLNLEITWGQNV